MRRAFAILGTLLVLGFVALIALAAFYPQQAMWIAFELLEPGPPPTARGLVSHADWGHLDVARERLTRALRERYPDGTPQRVLTAKLLDEGFKYDPRGRTDPAYAKTLTYEWSFFPCNEYVTVKWDTDARQRITFIEGSYYRICL